MAGKETCSFITTSVIGFFVLLILLKTMNYYTVCIFILLVHLTILSKHAALVVFNVQLVKYIHKILFLGKFIINFCNNRKEDIDKVC